MNPSPNLSDSDSPHWTEEIGQDIVCQNCGDARQGNYCSACGQKHLVKRLHFGSFVQRVFSELFSLDHSLLKTWLALFTQPGQLARDYVSGRQKCYLSPLTFFLIGTAAQLLVLLALGGLLREKIENGILTTLEKVQAANAEAESPEDALPKEVDPDEALDEGENEGEASKIRASAAKFADNYLSAIQQVYTYGALFFFCIPFAIALYLTHRLAGEKFRLGETMVFSLYIFGQMLILTAIANLLTIPFAFSLQPIGAIGVYLIYPLYAHAPFFKSTWFSRAMTFLSTCVASGIFFFSLITLIAALTLLGASAP